MANEYYSIIGVDPGADAGAVRKAYFRALREHTAEKDPIRHQELRRAYEVVGDEERRKEYDGLQVGGGEVARWMEQGNTAYGDEKWPEAEKAFKRALAISPDYLPARLQLARSVALGGDRVRAAVILRQVAAATDVLEVHSELGWIALSHVVVDTKNEPVNMEKEHKRLLLTAKEAFDRCIQLAPTNRVGYFGRAKVEYYREDFATARTWARKAAAADGKADFEDFPALSLVVETHVLQGQAELAAAVIREIQAITPPQPEVRAYAVEQFIRLGMMMMKAKAFRPAVEIFTACRGFLPEEPHLKDLVDANLTAANGWSEFERAKEDEQLLPVTRGLAVWAVGLYCGEFEDEAASEKFFDNVAEALDTFPAWQIAAQLRHLRDRYPAIWKCQDKLLPQMLAAVDGSGSGVGRNPHAVARAPQGGTEMTSNGGCGCLVLFAIVSFGALSASAGAYCLIA
jgi:tetratricopeptide (TPR) repeat protein